MKFNEVLKGAYLIELEAALDSRGFFARSFCRHEFEKLGLNADIVQCNVSYNKEKWTFRGMHYQSPPHEESKLVNCVRGAVYDVIVDMREGSPTHLKWFAAELTEENMKMLYVPEGFAHGFLTLKDSTTVFYQITEFYHPESGRGFRWNDPAFGIKLPQVDYMIVSEKDKSYGDYQG